MLRTILFEGLRTRRIRRTFLFQAAQSKADLAFADEIAELVAQAGGAITWVRVLGNADGAVVGTDHDVAGRIDADLLRRTLPLDRHDCYVCGPPAFMQAIHDHLLELGVPEARILAEAFGPSSLVRAVEQPSTGPAPLPPATAPVPVAYAASGKEARWLPGAGSLLELAEERGLSPPFACRSGSCGSCATRILSGAVSYAVPPSAPHADDVALLCCAVPAAGHDRLILEA